MVDGKQVPFKFSREIPEPVNLGRCRIQFYEYYVDNEQGMVYFYNKSVKILIFRA